MAVSWRLLSTGPGDGAFNMALDEVLLGEVAAGRCGPVLRFYQWQPPAVSLGYGQKAWLQVDRGKCRCLGVDLVRRLTGGRAVLHWDELTYSFFCAETDPLLSGPIEQSYRLIAHCLVAGLKAYGVEAQLVRRRPRGDARQNRAPLPCFSSAARWEVAVDGKKLVGSAQRRTGGAILQHGSVLTGDRHGLLLQLLPAELDQRRTALEKQLHRHSTDLASCIGGAVDRTELEGCLVEGFSGGLAAKMERSELSPAERDKVGALVGAKYGDVAWTWGEEGAVG